MTAMIIRFPSSARAACRALAAGGLVATLTACASSGAASGGATVGASGSAGASSATTAEASATPNTLSDAERAAGWQLLFDGTTTTGWRAYGRQDTPAGWTVVDGALTRTAAAGDLITREQYGNFELAFEWKLEEGGNSGVFYRGVELPGQPLYMSAPEMQLVDNSGHREGMASRTSAGAAYALYGAPHGVTKRPGEWNTSRILVNRNRVEHWINGTRLVQYEMASYDWADRVQKSTFKDFPQYGKATRGFIGLADQGTPVAFRSIKIRQLP